MAKFKKGDRVRVCLDANSQFRGRVGIVEEEPNNAESVVGYIVKFESKGNTFTYLFDEQALEAVSDK